MELTCGHEANTPTMHTPQPNAEKVRNNLRRRRDTNNYFGAITFDTKDFEMS